MYSRRYAILLVVLLSGATVAAHYKAVWDGWFLDDHWHRRQYISDQWSLQALLDATTIKPIVSWIPGGRRSLFSGSTSAPCPFLSRRSYTSLAGEASGLARAQPAASSGQRPDGSSPVPAADAQQILVDLGALLFVVYSHSVYAVAWLAAQNIVLQTTLMLGALLCYTRSSGLDLYAAPLIGAGSPGGEGLAGVLAGRGTGTFRWPWFVAALLLWALALGSRENAIVFPVLAAAFDLAFGGRQHLRERWPVCRSWQRGRGVCRLAIVAGLRADAGLLRPQAGWARVCSLVAGQAHPLCDRHGLAVAHDGRAVRQVQPGDRGPRRLFVDGGDPGDPRHGLLPGVLPAARGWWIWPLVDPAGLVAGVPILATPIRGTCPGSRLPSQWFWTGAP